MSKAIRAGANDMFQIRMFMIAPVFAAVFALGYDELQPISVGLDYRNSNASHEWSCAPARPEPCFDQGGQRAIYDLAKGQARYFLFGFASFDDKRDARLHSLGLTSVFSGCIIDDAGYEAGYNAVIEAALAADFGPAPADLRHGRGERPRDL